MLTRVAAEGVNCRRGGLVKQRDAATRILRADRTENTEAECKLSAADGSRVRNGHSVRERACRADADVERDRGRVSGREGERERGRGGEGGRIVGIKIVTCPRLGCYPKRDAWKFFI